MSKKVVEAWIVLVFVMIIITAAGTVLMTYNYCSDPSEVGMLRDITCYKMDMFIKLIGG